MSRAYDFIKDLNKDKDIWKIAVRVIDSWGVTGTNGVIHEVVKTQTLASGKKPCTNLILTDEGYCSFYFFYL
jgi:hypothetical protein